MLGKKGSLQDVIMMAIILLFVAMTVLLGYKVMTELDNEIQTKDITNNVNARAASTKLVGYYPGVIDNSILFLAIGLGIVTLILAAMVRFHPVFVPFFFIGLTIVVFISGMFSNIYQEMAANSNLVTQADNLIFISNILENLPFIVGVFGIILMIVMYKLRNSALQ